MVSTKSLRFLCLCVLAVAFAGCADTAKATMCETTGVICPSGMHCAAAEPVCIIDVNLCGNAKVDPGEVCDDGNTKDGDGCSADCKSDETCGNGILDDHASTPEVCDDGNTKDGDGCSHDCLSKEVCGNGIKDINEACDDGNNDDRDGCSHDCKSTESCGNGIVDESVGEVCDPPTAGTCSPDCRSLLACGNKTIDPSEECDDGQAQNGEHKRCRADCVLNRCGDGFIDTTPDPGRGGKPREDCDPAPKAGSTSHDIHPVETATCNRDCTAAKCGDGKVNPLNTMAPATAAGEQCDDGNNVDGDGCDSNCMLSGCGNGIQDPTEECDDGNNDNGDGCDANCTLPGCGNGIKDAGEECDDGNKNNNDDCRNDCIVNRCGDGFQDTAGTHREDCESTTVAGTGSHDLNSPESPTCNANCTTPRCGDNIVNHQFVANTTTGATEQCDDGLTAGNDDSKDCTHDCQINVCGDHLQNTAGSPSHREQCDDGNRIDTDGCTNACKTPTCGDGALDPAHEECDDGNHDDNDGCSSTCHIEFCGDGIVQTDPGRPEACDPGSLGGFSATCNPDCTLSACGDGIVNPLFHPNDPATGHPTVVGEQCDDHGVVEGDGCDKLCHFERCGNGIKDPGEACDDGNNVDTDGCTNACTLPRCGDHIIQAGENCDDGNNVTDACDYGAAGCTVCDSTCHSGPGIVTKCGDGVVQSDHEACDDGNNLNCGTCQNSCDLIVAASPATGLLFSGPGTEYADGDTFTLSDGVPGQAPVTFTFHSPTTGGPAIQIGGDSFTMAGKIQDAINGAGMRITATRQGHTGIVSLVNHQPSASGNTSITSHSSNPNATFGAVNFSGGAAGFCAANTKCGVDADCLSNHCDATSHSCKTCTANTDCASSNCETVSGQCQVCTEDRDCIGPNRACTVATGVCHAASSIAAE